MKSEDPIPVKILEREVSTSQPNGTTVEIDQIHLRSLDQAGVIRYVERHLARWPRNVTVIINSHECAFAEPSVGETRRVRPDGVLRDKLGCVQLVLKVSKTPLDEDLRGVSIFSNGVWHETTLAGMEGKEFANYIFGNIDVPELDRDDSPIPPFDLSRSMKLNPSNELVMALYAFIGREVDKLRRELVEKDKGRKATEEAKRLAGQAKEIARLINEDFEDYRKRIAKVKAKVAGGRDWKESSGYGEDEMDALVLGDQLLGEIVSDIGGLGRSDGKEGDGGETPLLDPSIVSGGPESERIARPSSSRKVKRKPKGGFNVDFDHMGVQSPRAVYVREQRTIYINLDHPQIAAAKGSGGTEAPLFRRLSYEVALTEYSFALASELAAREGFYEPSEAIVEIRETVNRMARRAAYLYEV